MRRIDSRPSRHDIMRDPLRMNSGLAQETEELLYSTLRQQRKRSSPVNLPSSPSGSASPSSLMRLRRKFESSTIPLDLGCA